MHETDTNRAGDPGLGAVFMMTLSETTVIDAAANPDSAVRETAKILRRGSVVGYPTETVYGLGCDAFNPEAVKRIADVKRRKADKPFLILIPNADKLIRLVRYKPGYLDVLARNFWPGPLTLLVPHQNQLPADLTQGQPLIGVRVSSDPVCMAIFSDFDHPLVSTSANPAGSPPAQSAREVLRHFENRIDLVLDGGERREQRPSTILDVSSEIPRLIREGAIPAENIERCLGCHIER